MSANVPARGVPETPAVFSSVRAASRLQSIDATRGLVIVIMALDHVRAYFTSARYDPLDLSQTNAALFVTRWITHVCAPAFLLLAGLSAFLVSQRSGPGALQRFLITRGLWLILLELTVVQFGWHFSFRYDLGLIAQVIWAIGASMIVLAALVRWPHWAIGDFGAAIIAGHHLLDGIGPEAFGRGALAWALIHGYGRAGVVSVFYPLIPWVGVMAVGYSAGAVYTLEARRRRAYLTGAGIVCLVLFVAVRGVNGYGDPYPWSSQPTAVRTLLAFVKVHKYPPSLSYLLVMLGLASLFLAAFETVRGKPADILTTFGRVPLFFYVVHLYTVHLAAGLIALLLGHGTTVLAQPFWALPQGWGFGVPGVYLVWLLVVATLYPACRWFAGVKRQRTDWWLSYL